MDFHPTISPTTSLTSKTNPRILSWNHSEWKILILIQRNISWPSWPPCSLSWPLVANNCLLTSTYQWILLWPSMNLVKDACRKNSSGPNSEDVNTSQTVTMRTIVAVESSLAPACHGQRLVLLFILASPNSDSISTLIWTLPT